MSLPLLDSITAPLLSLLDHLKPVAVESVPIASVAGRVLAEPLTADRDSPPRDVSAMDGYAIRLNDLTTRPLPIAATAAAGTSPIELPRHAAVRIFTGGPVPFGAEAIIPREETIESDSHVTIRLSPEQVAIGLHIRRQGENIQRSQILLEEGELATPPRMAAIATFGPAQLSCFRRLRVALLNTGDELVEAGKPAESWQIRDSNGPFLESLLGRRSWIGSITRRSIGDQPDELAKALAAQLEDADAVLLTGGVSMGAHDYVPETIQRCGGRIFFHRLPIKPGKPVLGGLGPRGQLIVGLPGNPVSVAVTSRRIAMPLLERLAGLNPREAGTSPVWITNPDTKSLEWIWYRLVRLKTRVEAEFIDSRGSGDLVALSMSDGFVELPAGQGGAGPWRYYSW